MIEPNTFLCGDCLPILRELPDGFADMCLTDPPYGVKRDKGFEGFEGFGGFGKPIARRRFEDDDEQERLEI
jgi:DNA modification methylase